MMSSTAKTKAEKPISKRKAEKSQLEGPAAYAPLPDEQSSADEAREHREKTQRQKKQDD